MSNPILSLLQDRYASRSISAKPLPETVVDDLVEACRLTPSCYNKQPWRFLFLQGEEALEKGRAALAQPNRIWADRAPLLVVAFSRRSDDCVLPDGRAYHEFDLGMAVMNLLLAATHCDLVARPMAGFDPAALRTAFELEPEDQPLVMVAIGALSPDESHLPETRRGLNEQPRVRKPAAEIHQRL